MTLIYTSTVVPGFQPEWLLDILLTAQLHNAERDITGVLLYRDERFLQVLEGADDDVEETYASIIGDSRHSDVALLIEFPTNRRLYPRWVMGFNSPHPEVMKLFPGYAPLLPAPIDGGSHDPFTRVVTSTVTEFWEG